ncbi:MAG TPA: pyridoxamine 5'-phosphate oxidase family protein [Synergistales bacterium]|nr:pyridoxamine 5'-phosphate oxidase family protein [Synergistales bacterium]
MRRVKENDQEVARAVGALLESQRVGVLGTFGAGSPYCSLVGFSFEPGYGRLYFATTRATRKFANLSETGRVALLVDNRGNREEDLHEASAVTAVGPVTELTGTEKDRGAAVHLTRHPSLAGFLESPTTALLALDVERYFLVRRFQEVMVLEVKR